MSVALIVLTIALLALFVVAVARPWLGLLVLLAGLPFNGLFLHVVGSQLGLTGVTATMLAAWHDALAAGVIVAAGFHWLRTRPRAFGALELTTAVVLALGLDSVLVAEHLTTALYAYRTFFEPIALAVAVVVLGRGRRIPSGLPSRAALTIVISGVVASLFSFWQVYVGGFSFLGTFYRSEDGSLSDSYFATQITQPRAIGTFNSPNEFGAFLVIGLCLLCVTAAVPIRGRMRALISVPLGAALVLSISRSAWVSLMFALVLFAVTLPRKREQIVALGSRLRRPQWWRTFALPVALFVVLVTAIVSTSGLANFVGATLGGRDPSAAAHLAQLGQIAGGNIENPAATDTPPPSSTPAAATPAGTAPAKTAPGASATPAKTAPGASAPPATPAATTPAATTPAATSPAAPTAAPCPPPASSVPSSSSPAPTPSAPVQGLRFVDVCSEVSTGTHLEPFGMGLGAVGPKSGRFGEPVVLINSEMWYLDYLWQAGYFGLFALFALAAVVVRRLWRGRAIPISRAALAVVVGLAAGALFIPVLDEPAVAIPMWTLAALGLLGVEEIPQTTDAAPTVG